MSRLGLGITVLLCLGMLGVVALVTVLGQRDRAALNERFGADRLVQVEAASRELTDGLEDIGDDLRFLSRAVATGDSIEHDVRTLLQVVNSYRAFALVGEAPAAELLLVEPGAEQSFGLGFYRTELIDTARRARDKTPGVIVTSLPLPNSGGWYRVFATAVADADPSRPRRALALLVNTEPLFAGIRLVGSTSDARLLLLGAHGKPVPVSDPVLTRQVSAADSGGASSAAFASLLRRMRAGERVLIGLDARQARALGLEEAPVIAAFAPIPVKDARHWSIATLISTSALEEQERFVWVRIALSWLAALVFFGGIAGYSMASSRRELALRETQRQATRLAQLHEQTQKILDHLPTAVLALSEDRTVMTCNRALELRAGAVTGRTLRAAFPQAEPSALDQLEALDAQARATGQVQILHGASVSLFGSVGHFSFYAVPLDVGAQLRSLVVLDDVSELRQLENHVLRTEKLRTVGILAAGIAHELGTPLGVIRGRAELAARKLPSEHPAGDSLRVIMDQIDHVSRTIRQLLDFSRPQPGSVRPVAMGPVLRQLEELLRMEADRRKVRLEFDADADLAPLAADPDQLQQVLLNLLLNGCHACREGGVVRLTAQNAPGSPPRVRLAVQDNGCGIAAENLHQVFDPFFTTKSRGEGTGLGLTVVSQIARGHGAVIELDSQIGRGTTVVLHWPTLMSERAHAS